MKACSRCTKELPETDFTVDRAKPDGLRTVCRACTAESRKAGYEAHREKHKARSKEYRAENADAILANRKAWRAENSELHRARARAWREANPEKNRAAKRQWKAAKIKSDPAFALSMRISSQLNLCLAKGKKTQPKEQLLGWTIAELKAHLERQFLRGMNWDNRSEWHIDHIVPLSSFNFTSPDDPDFRRAWALTNLRPLWASDNIRKAAKREHLL